MNKIFYPITVLLLCLQWQSTSAQDLAQESFEDLLGMTLEELMNVDIVSASKKSESSFESPLSSSVLTQEEILNSGASSIMEALRLIPGVIVREQTNGNYDIHLRGMDYLPAKAELAGTTNVSTLVMIDNRIVFRDFQGGTYWESLPVDIEDVQRIEVVRGPSSALYGPNAVSGVINIITKKVNDDGLHSTVNAQMGQFKTQVLNTNSSFKKNDFSLRLSSNFQNRDRYTSDYWDYKKAGYVVSPDSVRSVARDAYAFSAQSAAQRYPDRDLAQNKYGVNLVTSYQFAEEVNVDLAIGHQESQVQKVYVDNQNTPLTTENSRSSYVDVRAKVFGLDFQSNYLTGEQNTLGVSGWKLDYENINTNIEYEFGLFNEKLSLRSGLMYRSVAFDDKKSQQLYGNGFVGGRKELNTKSAFIRADFRPVSMLRFIGAVRAEKYNNPDDIYLSYQVGLNLYAGKNHVIRLLTSKANRGANIVDSYINYSAFAGTFNFYGNTDLKLMTMNLYELGYRAKLSEGMQLDAEFYMSEATNFTSMAVDSTVFAPKYASYSSVGNLDLTANQMGATMKIKYFVNRNIEISPYVSFQKTDLENLDEYSGDNTKDSLVNTSNKWTPSVYGGIYINATLAQKWNINLTPYFFTSQEFRYKTPYTDNIEAQLLLNASVSYRFAPKSKIYLTVHNLSGNDRRQFAFADPVSAMLTMGMRISL